MTPQARVPRAPSPATVWLTALSACLAAAALGCNSVQSQSLNSEGVALYKQGSYQEAAERFQTAIAKKPDSPDGYYNLAAALHQSGVRYNRPEELRQAEVLYNQCLERDANHVECYRGLAVLLAETGRRDASFRLLNNWASANPTSASPRVELARMLEETGQPQQATSQLVQALAVNPADPRALAALGRLRDQAGDYAQALANYQRSLAAKRDQPQVAARVAALQQSLGAAGTQLATAPTDTRTASGWGASGTPARY
ncbi:MAG: tetratricopeptide repeat protein [Lacipirellulaceae bacterium]